MGFNLYPLTVFTEVHNY